MQLFDSHCHLNDAQLNEQIDQYLQLAHAAGVQRMLDVGSDLDDSRISIEHAQTYNGVYAVVGIHPHAAEQATGDALDTLSGLLNEPGVVALGEIGLDYYYDEPARDTQRAAFSAQLDLAVAAKLPVVIHNRDAHADVLDMLLPRKDALSGCIIHCFSGSYETAKRCIDAGFMVSFSGTVTYKNAKKLQDVCKRIPLEHLLIETDAPYLTPEPHRGKRPNHPANVAYTAAYVAELRGMDQDALAYVTYCNACRVFGLGGVGMC